MALSLASLIQFHYPGRCTVFSDCQSAIHTITKITTSSALQDQHAVLLYPVALLPTKPTIHHIAAHPERRIKTRPWTQDEHGIHIADIAASNPAELHHYNVASLLTDSFTSSQILTGFLDLGTWSWCYTTGIPILLPIKTIWQEHAFKQYLTKRDESHVNLDLSPSHAQWSSRSWRLAAKVHQFSSCNTMTRARLQRILFHWSGIGANLHRDNRHCPEAFCSDCDELETEHHLLCHCNTPAVSQLKLTATLNAAHYLKTQVVHTQIADFMYSLHNSLLTHPHGYLLFFGLITKDLADSLRKLPANPILIQQAKKTVLHYLTLLIPCGIGVIDFARARRQTQTQRLAANSSQASQLTSQASQQSQLSRKRRSSAVTKSAQSTKRLHTIAHQAGLLPQFISQSESTPPITQYFKPTPKTSTNPFDRSNPHEPRRPEYGTTRPPWFLSCGSVIKAQVY